MARHYGVDIPEVEEGTPLDLKRKEGGKWRSIITGKTEGEIREWIAYLRESKEVESGELNVEISN